MGFVGVLTLFVVWTWNIHAATCADLSYGNCATDTTIACEWMDNMCVDRFPTATIACSGFYTEDTCNNNASCTWNSNFDRDYTSSAVCVNNTECGGIAHPDFGGKFLSPEDDCEGKVVSTTSNCAWNGGGTGVCSSFGFCVRDDQICVGLSQKFCELSFVYPDCFWNTATSTCIRRCSSYTNDSLCTGSSNAGRCVWTTFCSDAAITPVLPCESLSSSDCAAATGRCRWYADLSGGACRVPCENTTDCPTSDSTDPTPYCYLNEAGTCMDCPRFLTSTLCGPTGTNYESCLRCPVPTTIPSSCVWFSTSPTVFSTGECVSGYEAENVKVRGCDDIINSVQCEDYALLTPTQFSPGSECHYIFSNEAKTAGDCLLLNRSDLLNCSTYKVENQCSQVTANQCYWNNGKCLEYRTCDEIENATSCETASCTKDVDSQKCVSTCEKVISQDECAWRQDCYWACTPTSGPSSGPQCRKFETCQKLEDLPYPYSESACFDHPGCLWDAYAGTCETHTCGTTPVIGHYDGKGDCNAKGCFWISTVANGSSGTCYVNYTTAAPTCGSYLNAEECNADYRVAHTGDECNGKTHNGCYWEEGQCKDFTECADIKEEETCVSKSVCAGFVEGLCTERCSGLNQTECDSAANCAYVTDTLSCESIYYPECPQLNATYPSPPKCSSPLRSDCAVYTANKYGISVKTCQVSPITQKSSSSSCTTGVDKGCDSYVSKDSCESVTGASGTAICAWDGFDKVCRSYGGIYSISTSSGWSVIGAMAACSEKGGQWSVGTGGGTCDASSTTPCEVYTDIASCNVDNTKCEMGCIWRSNNVAAIEAGKCLRFMDCATVKTPLFLNPENDCNAKESCYWDSGACKARPNCTLTQSLSYCLVDKHTHPVPTYKPFGGCWNINDENDCTRTTLNGNQNCYWLSSASTTDPPPRGTCYSYFRCSEISVSNARGRKACNSARNCEYVDGKCLEIKRLNSTCNNITHEEVCQKNYTASCFWRLGQCLSLADNCSTVYSTEDECNNMAGVPHYNNLQQCVYVWDDETTGSCVEDTGCGIYKTVEQCREKKCFWKTGFSGGHCFREREGSGISKCADYCESSECNYDDLYNDDVITHQVGYAGCIWNADYDSGKGLCLEGGCEGANNVTDVEYSCYQKIRDGGKCYFQNGECRAFPECGETNRNARECSRHEDCYLTDIDNPLGPICKNFTDHVCAEIKDYADCGAKNICVWDEFKDHCYNHTTCDDINNHVNPKYDCIGKIGCYYNSSTNKCVDFSGNCSTITNSADCYGLSSCVWESKSAVKCAEFFSCSHINSTTSNNVREECPKKPGCYYNSITSLCSRFTRCDDIKFTSDNTSQRDCADTSICHVAIGAIPSPPPPDPCNDISTPTDCASGGCSWDYGDGLCKGSTPDPDPTFGLTCRLIGNSRQVMKCAAVENADECGKKSDCFWNSSYSDNKGGCFSFTDCAEINLLFDKSAPYDCSRKNGCMWNSRLALCSDGTCESANNSRDCNLKDFCFWNSSLDFGEIVGGGYGTRYGACTYFWSCDAIENDKDCRNKGCGWDEKKIVCGGAESAKAKMSAGSIAAVTVLAVLLGIAVVAIVILLILLLLARKS